MHMSESFPHCLKQEDDALQHILSPYKCLNYGTNGVHTVAITFAIALPQMCLNTFFFAKKIFFSVFSVKTVLVVHVCVFDVCFCISSVLLF